MADPASRTTLPYGWVQRANGDIWSSADERKARPVAYRVAGGWMVSGIHSPPELKAIAEAVLGLGTVQ